MCVSSRAAQISDWLRGRSFASTFRPVPLQMLVCECEKLAKCTQRRGETGVDGPRIARWNPQSAALDAASWRSVGRSANPIDNLALEAMREGKQVLVFCNTKVWVRKAARAIASAAKAAAGGGAQTPDDDKVRARRELVDQLRSTPAGLDPDLEQASPSLTHAHTARA